MNKTFCYNDLVNFTCGKVFAVMWQMGELERNFMIMHTSSGAGENIIGDWNQKDSFKRLFLA